MVGRALELAQVEAALWPPGASRPAIVAIAGEAGIGKSRLASEVAGRAARRGVHVLHGAGMALAGEAPPLAPLTTALADALGQLDARARAEWAGGLTHELGVLLPPAVLGGEAAESGLGLDEGLRQQRVFIALVEFLARRATGSALLLVLEDAHAFDRATGDFLRFLARVGEPSLAVLLTIRTDALDRAGDSPTRLLAELAPSGGIARVELGGLSVGELGRLVSDLVGRTIDDTAAASLHRRTDGNPYFAQELALAGLSPDGPIPPSLQEVLLARVAAQPRPVQALLRTMAVLGRDADERILVEAAGVPQRDLVRALRAAVASRILSPDAAAGRYRFRHGLMREVIHADLLPTERRRIHARVAEVLVARPGLRPAAEQASMLAHHWQAAGEWDRALEQRLAAADHALEIGATADAYRQLREAVSIWERTSAAARRHLADRRALHRRLLAAAHASAHFVEAIAALDELDRLGTATSPAEEIELLGFRCNAEWALGDYDAALAAAERAVERAPVDDGRLQAVALRLLAGTLMVGNCSVEALPIAREGLRHAIASGDRSAERYLRGVIAYGLQAIGRGDDAVRESRRAYGIKVRGDPIDSYAGPINHASLMALCGRYDEALRTASRSAAEIERAGLVETYGVSLDNIQLYVLTRMGRHAEAESVLARGANPGTQMSILLQERAALEAVLRIRQGRLAEAARLVSRLDLEVMSGEQDWIVGLVRLAELEVLLHQGDVASAATLAARIDGTQHASITAFRLRLLALAQRAVSDAMAAARGRSQGLAAERTRLARVVETINASIEQPVAEWRAAILQAEAEARRGRPDAADRWQLAVDAWTQAANPFEAGYGWCRLGEALLARHDRAGGAEALRTARETAVRIDAPLITGMVQHTAARGGVVELLDDDQPPPSTLSVPRGQVQLGGLSSREREVLALVAEGLSNRQISERLFITEKTAATHVSNILGKLGATSRAQAAAILAASSRHD